MRELEEVRVGQRYYLEQRLIFFQVTPFSIKHQYHTNLTYLVLCCVHFKLTPSPESDLFPAAEEQKFQISSH